MAQDCAKLVAIGIKEILSKLEDDELFGLAWTVTHGLLKNKINTREEAFDAIVKYSPNTLSILKRRAITRDVLFSYLHDNNVKVVLPVVKDKLIEKICMFWDLPLDDVREGTSASTDVLDIKEAGRTSDINVMAEKFSEWFYSIMNQNECMGSEHFFPDARLKLNLILNDRVESSEAGAPEQIVQVLFKTKSEHNLYFNPNLTCEGVQGRVDPHGLVMMLACGTLHSNNVCVGVFEQVFALARDPFCDNNWKIKSTELNLRSKGEICELPNLSDSDLTSTLLALPET